MIKKFSGVEKPLRPISAVPAMLLHNRFGKKEENVESGFNPDSDAENQQESSDDLTFAKHSIATSYVERKHTLSN